MVRLIGLVALLAYPAHAVCFGTNLPKKLRYDSGHTVEILGHARQDLTIPSILPNCNPDGMTVHSRLFTLYNSHNGTTFSYELQSKLALLHKSREGFILLILGDSLGD